MSDGVDLKIIISHTLARYVNNKALFNSMSFANYNPRKGFRCAQYLEEK